MNFSCKFQDFTKIYLPTALPAMLARSVLTSCSSLFFDCWACFAWDERSSWGTLSRGAAAAAAASPRLLLLLLLATGSSWLLFLTASF